jgi:hypothetical protein
VNSTFRVCWAGLFAGALIAACGGGSGDGQSDAGALQEGGSTPQDDGGVGADATINSQPDAGASPIDGQHGPDGGLWCPGTLVDAGFSSLADLPIAQMCASASYHQVVESTLPCQGYNIVEVSDPLSSCAPWWLFDATGALVATGSRCGASVPGCSAAVPGLSFPYQCFINGGWLQVVGVCTD